MRRMTVVVILAGIALIPRANALRAQASADEAVAIGTVCKAGIVIGEGYATESISVEAAVTVLEVVRGEKAWEMVRSADPSNKPPAGGMEYVAVRVRFEYGHQGGRDPSYGVRLEQFASVSETGKQYERPSTAPPKPVLNGRLYPGESLEGWIVLLVSADDAKPRMTFGNNYNRVWFRLY